MAAVSPEPAPRDADGPSGDARRVVGITGGMRSTIPRAIIGGVEVAARPLSRACFALRRVSVVFYAVVPTPVFVPHLVLTAKKKAACEEDKGDCPRFFHGPTQNVRQRAAEIKDARLLTPCKWYPPRWMHPSRGIGSEGYLYVGVSQAMKWATGLLTFLMVRGPCLIPAGIKEVKLSLMLYVLPSMENSISAPRSMISS